jgi:flavin reductase
MNLNSDDGKNRSTINVSEACVDITSFRDVMRRLAGSVTVITTEDEGSLHGFTATAVCSVCAEPPTVLIVVNRSARTHPHIKSKGAFAVNILADHQVELANLFATKSAEQFANVPHVISPRGVPVITGATASIECCVIDQMEVGTHTIFIGAVVGTDTCDGSPLIYHDATFARAAAMA